MAGKHTIEDIARLAGVSKTTVSRVLNKRPDVDPTTRNRVLRVIETEGFVPSATASGLAGGRSHLIGIMVPAFHWNFVPDVIHGVSESLDDTNYEIVLYSTNTNALQNDKGEIINRIFSSKLVAGMIAIHPGHYSHHIIRRYHQGFPVVIIDDTLPPPQAPWIGTDNHYGAYLAVKHLLASGHQRIAHIQGIMETLYACRERHRGYLTALDEAGIPIDEKLIVQGYFHPPIIEEAARKLLTLPLRRRPTAIFCSNDETAYGVLKVADELGLVVPRDLALVGFDDIPPSVHVRPRLTTVTQQFHEMGKCAAKLLQSLLTTGHTEPNPQISLQDAIRICADVDAQVLGQGTEAEPVHVQFTPRLLVRESCGAKVPV